MSKTMKRIARSLAITTALSLCAMGGDMPYGLAERKPRATMEEDNKFVDKQGYKTPSVHDREEQRKRRLIRKAKKKRGHKHGGGRK